LQAILSSTYKEHLGILSLAAYEKIVMGIGIAEFGGLNFIYLLSWALFTLRSRAHGP